MKLLNNYVMSAIFPLILISNTEKKSFQHSLHGVVADKETGKPLPDIYIYTVKGEEEAITNKSGQFKFVTWQKLPLTLNVIHKEGENVRVVVSNPFDEIKIKL